MKTKKTKAAPAPSKHTCKITLTLDGVEQLYFLDLNGLIEIEKITGDRAFEIYTRLTTGASKVAEIVETIRYGLIGGGMSEPEAAAFIKAHVEPYPLADTLPVAQLVAAAALFGTDAVQMGDEAA